VFVGVDDDEDAARLIGVRTGGCGGQRSLRRLSDQRNVEPRSVTPTSSGRWRCDGGAPITSQDTRPTVMSAVAG
jgi:hypothetical protein